MDERVARLPRDTVEPTEVLRLVTDGHSNRAIADLLFLSERTVEQPRPEARRTTRFFH